MRRCLLVIPVLVLALVAAGCGGSSGSSGTTATADWADNLCSSFTTWKDSMTSAAGSLKGGNLSEDSVKSAIGDMKNATNTFVDDLEGLGKPDTDAGQQAKESVDKLSDEIKTDVDDIENAAGKVSGVSGAVAAVTSVTTTLGTMSSQVSSTFDELQSLDAKGDLENAFKQSDSCSGLTSTG